MTENNTEKLTLSERRRRIFSEDFKRKKLHAKNHDLCIQDVMFFVLLQSFFTHIYANTS
jgi:hypothetical protein